MNNTISIDTLNNAPINHTDDNNNKALMSHEEMPLISCGDGDADYNVSHLPQTVVLTQQSAETSIDAILLKKNAILHGASTKFVFDTTATRHIVCNRMLLTNFQN